MKNIKKKNNHIYDQRQMFIFFLVICCTYKNIVIGYYIYYPINQILICINYTLN